MSTVLRRMGAAAAADRTITPDEAKALVAKAKEDGVVSASEKQVLRAVMVQYRDLFQPGALDVVKALLDPPPLPPPVVGTKPLELSPTGAERPVFLSSSGVFSTKSDGSAPTSNLELGEAVFRAAECIDNAPKSVMANASKDVRIKTFEELKLALATVPADGAPPAGLDANQALQLRASCGAVLLDLLNASTEPELRTPILKSYEALVRKETDPRLRDNLIFHLSNADAVSSPEVKAVSDSLLKQLAPTSPPYEKWFANGNKTVNLSWTVGEGEFWKGFTNTLKANGFKAVGPENEFGVTTYEAKIDKPGVGETTFRIQVKQGGTGILAPMNDAGVQIVGYDGHSNWGRNMTASVRNGPEAPQGGDGKLIFYNLCVGKGVLDRVKEKYENAQVVTTYAAAYFNTDGAGQMTRGEGVQALLKLVDGVAARSDWTQLHRAMNSAANMGPGRTWDNYITPISTQVREQVLDRDNDGQADYLDKHFNYSTFRVPEDTAREFQPVRQDRPAGVLDGTKVLVAANMVNTLSEFSGILDQANPDSRVFAGGWFDPKPGEPKDVVRFTEQKSRTGKTEYVMSVSARYSHMSEEALRATTVYELTRYLQDTGKLRLSPTDSKLAGVLAYAQSLAVDESFRTADVFGNFLKRYNLPESITLAMATTALASHTGHNYAGDTSSIAKLKSLLPPDAVTALARTEVGVPVTII